IDNQEVATFKIGLESTSVYSFQPSMFLHYDEVEKSIKRIMAGLTQTLESIPGIGPIFAASIIAEIGL
ncbi:hypothetical protein COI89_18795, partial [Bacillus cereus]